MFAALSQICPVTVTPQGCTVTMPGSAKSEGVGWGLISQTNTGDVQQGLLSNSKPNNDFSGIFVLPTAGNCLKGSPVRKKNGYVKLESFCAASKEYHNRHKRHDFLNLSCHMS